MELQGNGFVLRGWLLTDTVSRQRNADNKKISRFLFDRFPRPYTIQHVKEWVTKWQTQDPFINFAIVEIMSIMAGVVKGRLKTTGYHPTISY